MSCSSVDITIMQARASGRVENGVAASNGGAKRAPRRKRRRARETHGGSKTPSVNERERKAFEGRRPAGRAERLSGTRGESVCESLCHLRVGTRLRGPVVLPRNSYVCLPVRRGGRRPFSSALCYCGASLLLTIGSINMADADTKETKVAASPEKKPPVEEEKKVVQEDVDEDSKTSENGDAADAKDAKENGSSEEKESDEKEEESTENGDSLEVPVDSCCIKRKSTAAVESTEDSTDGVSPEKKTRLEEKSAETESNGDTEAAA